jgi:hypothetical protein
MLMLLLDIPLLSHILLAWVTVLTDNQGNNQTAIYSK